MSEKKHRGVSLEMKGPNASKHIEARALETEAHEKIIAEYLSLSADESARRTNALED